MKKMFFKSKHKTKRVIALTLVLVLFSTMVDWSIMADNVTDGDSSDNVITNYPYTGIAPTDPAGDLVWEIGDHPRYDNEGSYDEKNL